MASDLAPNFVVITYVSGGRTHKQTVPFINGIASDPGEEPQFTQRNSVLVGATAAVTAWITALKVIMPTTAVFTGFECFKKVIGEDPDFLYGDDLDIAGTNVTALNPDNQAVITFRSGNGGNMKVQLMDTSVADDARIPARVSAVAPWGTIITYLLGATAWNVARDNGYAIQGLFVTTKTNDALRKRRILDA